MNKAQLIDAIAEKAGFVILLFPVFTYSANAAWVADNHAEQS